MIQLLTSPVKRTATAFCPSWYRTATTTARVSNDPSEFTTRTPSSNSSGNPEANNNSCAVPNSITVCSWRGRIGVASETTFTGIRTADAFGNRCANFSTHVSVAPLSATLMSLNKWPQSLSSRCCLCPSEKRTPGEQPDSPDPETENQSVNEVHEGGQSIRRLMRGKQLRRFDLGNWRAGTFLAGVSG
jgi:hypothetical protein